MSLRLLRPTLGDYAYVAHRMDADEREQFIAMSGMGHYDADVCARAAAATPGEQFAYADADGYPVLIGGFEPLRPGVFMGWQMAAEGAWAQYGAQFHRASLRMLANLLNGGAHRIQACPLASRTHALEWYGRLGMMNEGIQHCYCTDGRDAVMFARTRKRP
jgi:hypothetical protein